MKKINSLFIIMFSTFVSVVTMVTYDNYASNSMHYEEDKISKIGVVQNKKPYSASKAITNDNHVKVVKKDEEETSNTKYNLESDDLSQKGFSNAYKSEDKKNVANLNVEMKESDKNKDTYNDIHLPKREDGLENYYYENNESEQSVFKVSTGDIKKNLTTSDKIKLLYVSMQLGKDDYKKVEEYLYAKDAEDGVLKALKLLKEDLSKKEYEKVRKIAGRFIDMDAAERLY